MIVEGGVDPGHLKQHGIRLVTVHQRDLTSDMFAAWERHDEEPIAPGTFKQILPPSHGSARATSR